jgi:hypothetical protein
MPGMPVSMVPTARPPWLSEMMVRPPGLVPLTSKVQSAGWPGRA